MSKDFLHAWATNLLHRSTVQLATAVHAVGLHDVHTGPGWQYARIEIEAEPAHAFCVSFEMDATLIAQLQKDYWLDEAVFGVLDMLATNSSSPVFGVRIRVVKAEQDPIRSSRIAFRLAGRAAGGQILRLAAAPSTCP